MAMTALFLDMTTHVEDMIAISKEEEDHLVEMGQMFN